MKGTILEYDDIKKILMFAIEQWSPSLATPCLFISYTLVETETNNLLKIKLLVTNGKSLVVL